MKRLKVILVLVMLTTVVASTVALKIEPEHIEAGYLDQDDLDNRVIFQNFSLFQPYEKNMYKILAQNTNQLKQWGITDVWTAPGSRSFDLSRYNEGYAISDRYDLGEFPQGVNNEKATKYGTSDELKKLVNKLHQSGLKIQMDLVPNQMFGMKERQFTKVTRVNSSAVPWTQNGKQTSWVDRSYLAYTKGSFQGQQKYGVIKEWNQNHFIGTSLQNQGDRTFKDGSQNDGKPYYYFDSKNYNLPSELQTKSMLKAFAKGQVNLVEGYLSVDSWLVGDDGVWRPVLAYTNHYQFDQYLSSKGYTKSNFYSETSATQAVMLNEFLQAWNYNITSEEESLANSYTGIDGNDQFMFTGKKMTNTIGYGEGGNAEFLIGLDVDYLNEEVKNETANWMDFLLDKYNFDGFRVDAASHFDKSVLTTISQKVKAKGNGSIAYIETYTPGQKKYVDSINNEMMSMNYDLFYTMNGQLGYPSERSNVANLFDNNNRYGTSSVNKTPNWSFVNNHDQEKNQVNKIIMAMKGIRQGSKPSFYSIYTKELERQALETYFNDMNQVDKKWASHNVLSQYAYMLSMKSTTPTVFYGDLYRGDQSYMSAPTIYYDGITKMLEARKQFAKGDEKQYRYQTGQSSEGQDLIANVRIGTNKNEGMAVIIADNASVDETITVNVGSLHAGQYYKDILGRDSEKKQVDSNGNITVHVKGTNDQFVKGQVGVWVPEVEETKPETTQEIKEVSQSSSRRKLNVVISATENGKRVEAKNAQIVLKSETTGREYRINSREISQTDVGEINVKLRESMFTSGHTYSLKLNGRDIKSTLSNQTYTFSNGNTYTVNSSGGNFQITIGNSDITPPSPTSGKQKFVTFATSRTLDSVNVIADATENGQPLDLSRAQVVLKSETTGEEHVLQAARIKSLGGTRVLLRMEEWLFARNEAYTITINGRKITTDTSTYPMTLSGYKRYQGQNYYGVLRIIVY